MTLYGKKRVSSMRYDDAQGQGLARRQKEGSMNSVHVVLNATATCSIRACVAVNVDGYLAHAIMGMLQPGEYLISMNLVL